jgi:D-alanyl-lipoteichoic acid acyltransferase DltB (MBOAT superfamily)
VLEVAGFLLAAHLALRVLGCGTWRRPVALAGLACALVLFVINKLPVESEAWGVGAVNPALAAVGFSYVFLRLIDVGRVVYEGGRPPPDPASTVNYLVPFHMLAAGPIQSYEDFIDQPAVPKPVTAVEALEAVERIALGLFKKFVVAYIIGKLFLTGFNVSGPYMLFEVQVHYLWFYLDFSGYSDIAVGIGKLMGVRTPENFDKPYLARNMIDFWDRWHISLSLWVRRNLFIPMQLAMARRTRGKRALLIATVAFTVSFLLCGLWHGISWPYFAWGAMHALGLVVTNTYRHHLTKRLGTKGVKAYKEKLIYRLLGQFITFQWVAFSLLVIAYPWKGFEP